MRDLFPGYYRPTESEFKQLWTEGLLVLDANVLLNLYRYSAKTRIALIRILKSFGDRLWLPHQAAQEFHENRLNVIAKQASAYSDLESALSDASGKLKASFSEYSRHALLDTNALLDRVNALHEAIKRELADMRAKHPDLLVEDSILESVTELLAGKVGQPYSPETLLTRQKEAEVRFARGIPPGFADSKTKGNERSCGDYVLWAQLLEHAEGVARPVIMVTDDSKEDWWRRLQGKTIGPRPELVAEMRHRAKVLFHLYRPDSFMEQAGTALNQKVNEPALEEVRSIQRAREAAEATHAVESQLHDIVRTHQRGVEALRARIQEAELEIERHDAYQKLLLADFGPMRGGGAPGEQIVERFAQLSERRDALEASKRELLTRLREESDGLEQAKAEWRRRRWHRLRQQGGHATSQERPSLRKVDDGGE